MPIAATVSALQNLFKNGLGLDKAASPDLVATNLSAAIAAIAPSGLFPPSPTPIPLVPAGQSGAQSLFKNAFTLDVAADPNLTAMMLATGVSIICPTVPPAGLSLLQSQFKNALTLELAADPDLAATTMANAVISYFSVGGVV